MTDQDNEVDNETLRQEPETRNAGLGVRDAVIRDHFDSPKELAEYLDVSEATAREMINDRNQRVHVTYPPSSQKDDIEGGEGEYEPYINQPIEIDAAPRFHLGRVLTRIEILVALFAGTVTVLGLATSLALSLQISIALTVTATIDIVIQKLGGDTNPAEIAAGRDPGELGVDVG